LGSQLKSRLFASLYAWRKHLEEEADPEPQIRKAVPVAAVQAGTGRKAA